MKKFVITIGREYGSGGRIIGEKLAKRLGVNFYDKNMIDKIAEESDGIFAWALEGLKRLRENDFRFTECKATEKLIYEYRSKIDTIFRFIEESGFTKEAVEALDGKKTSSFLYSLFMSTQPVTLSDTLFKAQTDIIRDLVSKESCVIVGRCADYVLSNCSDCGDVINAFIYADMATKVKRSIEEYKDKNDNPEMFVRRMDKTRASYYNYYTPNQWGARDNYDVLINSAVGIDTTVDMLYTLAQSKFGGNK